MKVALALCGLAALLQVGRVDAARSLKGLAAADEAPPAFTRHVTMRDSIIPQWSDVAPPDAKKVKLNKVQEYWDALERNDLALYTKYASSEEEKLAVETAIKKYYSAASSCLNWYWLNTNRERATFERNMKSIQTCLESKEMPAFDVPDGEVVEPLPAAYTPVLDESGEDEKDEVQKGEGGAPPALVDPSDSDQVVTVSSPEEAVEPSGPSWEDLHPPGWNGSGLPDEPTPEEPEPVAIMVPDEPSWEDLHPPGWNGSGLPDEPTPEEPEPVAVDPEEPTLEEPPPVLGGKGKGLPPTLEPESIEGGPDSIPPWLRNNGDGGDNYDPNFGSDSVPDSLPSDGESTVTETSEIMEAPEIPELVPMVGGPDSIPPWLRNNGGDNYDPDFGWNSALDNYPSDSEPTVVEVPEIMEPPPMVGGPGSIPWWYHDEELQEPGGTIDSLPPWARDPIEVPEPVTVDDMELTPEIPEAGPVAGGPGSIPWWLNEEPAPGDSIDSLPPWARGQIQEPEPVTVDIPTIEPESPEIMEPPPMVGGPGSIPWWYHDEELQEPGGTIDSLPPWARGEPEEPVTVDIPTIEPESPEIMEPPPMVGGPGSIPWWYNIDQEPGGTIDSLPPWARGEPEEPVTVDIPEPIPSWFQNYGNNGDYDPNFGWDSIPDNAPDAVPDMAPDGVISTDDYVEPGAVPAPGNIMVGNYELPLWFQAQYFGTKVYEPTAAAMPGFSALDLDGDHAVTASEWAALAQKLHSSADAATSNARDKVGKGMLDNIISFHYGNLNACLARKAPESVPKEAYEQLADALASKCNIKFRYSLLAGPAPFEWIARRAPTITGAELTAWFGKQLQLAIDDVKQERVDADLESSLPIAEKTLSCLSHMLSSRESLPIDRDEYYTLINAALACGSGE